MIRPRRRYPVDQNGRHHFARGVVTSHTSHTARKWRRCWKKEVHQGIVVRFSPEWCRGGNHAHGTRTTHSNVGGFTNLPRQIEVNFERVVVRDQYPIGSMIDVFFFVTGKFGGEEFRFTGVCGVSKRPVLHHTTKQLQTT